LASLTAGEAALRTIRTNLGQVFAPGVDLVDGDPEKALDLLTAAYQAIDAAKKANVPSSTLDPLMAQTVGGLDRLYRVVPVSAATVISFADSKTPFDIQSMILGPDGVPYVLDKVSSAVYRIDLRTKTAVMVYREKSKQAGATEGVPKILTTGGRDLLVIDARNVVWRWRAIDAKGDGRTTRVKVSGAAGWGDDVRDVGTFVRDKSAGLYNLYVIDPSEQQILAYPPPNDGSGFPSPPQKRLAVARDVSKITDLYIDGDIFVVDAGTILRFVGGKSEGWSIEAPGDTLLRDAPSYRSIASASDKRTGLIYAWDPANRRVVALDKAKGTFVEQYRLA